MIDRNLTLRDLDEQPDGADVHLLAKEAKDAKKAPPEWPEPPGSAAFYGLAGEIVEAIDPHTEGDRTAVLAQTLVAFGNSIGSGPHAMVGATRHALNLFVAIVGATSKARKGDSWTPVERTFALAEPEWAAHRVVSGLSSGEGVIWNVRDPIERREPVRENGKATGKFRDVVVDAGEPDKRLLVVESELARALRAMERHGNTLSAVVRQCWDSGKLRILTKTNPAVATGAHVSIAGHVTIEELRRELADTEMSNGFANRILWIAAKRSKLLAEPEPYAGPKVERLAARLHERIERARTVGEITRDDAARELWCEVYPSLSEARDGLAGSLLARGEAQVLRLSAVFALMGGSADVRVEHLAAALELWGYVERSVQHIFGDALGDPVADTIARALQAGPMTRTAISGLFGRHERADRISGALRELVTRGRATTYSEETSGRPTEWWAAGA